MNEKDVVWICPKCKRSYEKDAPHLYQTTFMAGELEFSIKSSCNGTLIPYIRKDLMDVAVEAANKALGYLKDRLERLKVPEPYMIQEVEEALEQMKEKV